ncbi:MAG: cupredoxin domain-containing protein [Acidimicrobiales bacterium]
MFSAASKLGFIATAGALVAGIVYAVGIGDRDGFALLMFSAAVFFVLAVGIFYFAGPSEVGVEAAEAVATPTRGSVPDPSPWPMGIAASLALVIVALAAGAWFLAAGVVGMAAMGFLWFAQSWREHPSWTPAMTDRLNERFVVPFGLPGLAIALVGLGAISLSRLFLAVSVEAAPIVATAVAVVILAACFYIASSEQMGRTALSVVAGLATLLLLASGVVGVVVGEREFHQPAEAEVLELHAESTAFDTDAIELVAHSKVAVALTNNDAGLTHNFSIYDDTTDPLFRGELITGPGSATYDFEAPDAGTYRFQCDVHPAEMNGSVTVVGADQGGATEADDGHS